jgi:uncharacterized protein
LSTSTAASHTEAVTVLATRTARPGREREFIASLQRLRQILADQPGHLGIAIMEPRLPRRDALVVYRFDSAASLRAWQNSPARQAQIEATAALTETPPHERADSAMDGWFVTTGGRVVRPPPRWKTWLVSTVVIWALLTAITITTGPLLSPLPLPMRFAIVVPTVGAVMTWIVMPILTRLLSRWLH